MQKLFLTVVFLAFMFPLKAQQVALTILCNNDQSTIPYAHICTENLVTGEKSYQLTDIHGKATITVSDTSLVSVSFVGYQTLFDTLAVAVAEKKYYLNKTGFNLEEVVVTGQYKAVPSDKSIYDITLLDKNLIEQKAATNLAGLLSNELNIDISHDPSTGTGLKMQGISGENVKILIDGVPVIGRLNGNIDLSQLDLSNVDHIEIVEGPMSVIYGSNALAGVINIITKDNKYARFKANATTHYESVGTYNANTNLAFNRNRNSFTINAGRNFFAGFDTAPATRSMEYKPKEQYNAGLTYAFRTSDFEVKSKVDFFREHLLDRSNLVTTPYNIRGFDTWYYTLRANANMQLRHELSEHSAYTFLGAYSYYDRTREKYLKDMTTLETNLTAAPSDHDTTRFDAVVARGTYHFTSDDSRFEIQAGFDFNREKGEGKRMKNGEETIGDYAVFTGIIWNITPDFVVQPGLRVAYNTKYDAPLVPSLNMKYTYNSLNFRASYARGFRAPSLKELYLYFYDSNHQIEGNDNLQAEYSHNFNFSSDYALTWGNSKFETGIKAFYNSIENMITLVQVDPENELHYQNENVGHFETIGGELNIKYKYLPYVSLSAGFIRMGRTDFYDDDNFIFSNNFNSELTVYGFKNTASFGLFYKYNGKYPFYTYYDDLELNYLSAYHDLDCTLSKSFRHKLLVLSVGVKNIFDNVRINSSTANTGSHGSSTSASSLAGWGRTYFASLKINIVKY